MRDTISHASTLRADPLADDTVARILGPWDKQGDNAAQWAAIATVNDQLTQWQTNGALPGWRAGAEVAPAIAAALEDYIQAGLRLPDWAEPAKIARAEELFMDMSMLSCTLLFCASLPECYVIPDLAGVLHAAGQLEQHTDYRIRSTAAMLFPVMMHGGLTDADGGGVAQTLKVRLIHATIRHLILRGNPSDAVRAGAPATVAPLPALAGQPRSMQGTLYAHGWNVARDGLPCNQEQLAYTLLTFSYVFLRALRRLGLGLPAADEHAYLHTWNVLGHVLGIERTMMAETMEQAEALFTRMQAGGRVHPYLPDSRPALGAALMRTMENELPLRVLKPFPVLLTRHLCGPAAARELGLTGRVSLLSRALFAVSMGTIRLVDATARLFWPQFSLSRLVTRVVGYQFTVKLLMDQTRPLKLPAALLNQVGAVTAGWDQDRQAPRWINALEARLTGRRKRLIPTGPQP
jgi:hypothetical protein